MKLKHAPEEARVAVGLDVAREALCVFHEARRGLKVTSPFGVPVGSRTWLPPEDGVFRLDVDACVCHDEGLFGYGAIVRDGRGCVRAALMCPAQGPDSVVDAEVNAMIYGVGLCLQEGLGPIVVYSDSLTVIRALKGVDGVEDYLEINAPIVADLVRDGLILDFRHMYREANNVAHMLARAGASCDSLKTWNCNFPSWLRALIG